LTDSRKRLIKTPARLSSLFVCKVLLDEFPNVIASALTLRSCTPVETAQRLFR
jgi:hypothetical protein